MAKPKHKVARTVPIRCSIDIVGEETHKRILKMWRFDVALAKIARKVNPGRDASRTLTVIDLLGVVKLAISEKKAKQRSSCPDELTVAEFEHMFKLWKLGYRLAEIQKTIDNPRKNFFIKTCFQALNKRYKDYKTYLLAKEDQKNMHEAAIAVSQDLNHAMKFCQTVFVDGREALLIFVDELPVDLRRTCDGYPDLGMFLKVVDPGENVKFKINLDGEQEEEQDTDRPEGTEDPFSDKATP